MRYFIDTNIFIFMTAEPDALMDEVRKELEDCENMIIMSSESIREIALLVKGGRLDKKKWGAYADVIKAVELHGIKIRHIDDQHLQTLFNLEPAKNHYTPADLMIISQAITEKIKLISSDEKFKHYKSQGLDFWHNKRPRH